MKNKILIIIIAVLMLIIFFVGGSQLSVIIKNYVQFASFVAIATCVFFLMKKPKESN